MALEFVPPEPPSEPHIRKAWELMPRWQRIAVFAVVAAGAIAAFFWMATR
jgi:hypothetical protein